MNGADSAPTVIGNRNVKDEFGGTVPTTAAGRTGLSHPGSVRLAVDWGGTPTRTLESQAEVPVFVTVTAIVARSPIHAWDRSTGPPAVFCIVTSSSRYSNGVENGLDGPRNQPRTVLPMSHAPLLAVVPEIGIHEAPPARPWFSPTKLSRPPDTPVMMAT